MLTYAVLSRGKDAGELHVCLMSATMDSTLLTDYFSSSIGSPLGQVPRVSGTQFTCFTGTKLQTLTLLPDMRDTDYFSSSIGSGSLGGPVPRVSGTEFTCVTCKSTNTDAVTGTKVQILTLQCHACQLAASVFVLLY
jgi:hypothetical protein